MFMFNRKRISWLAGMILMSLVAFTFQTAELEPKGETLETVALPVSNHVIVVDAGHGKPDEGAESNQGTTEAETNLKIALKLQNLLEQSGATAVLTRSDENAIYSAEEETLREKKVSDIRNRVKIGNESSADIFVSIHLNKIPEQQYWGWQCFYQEGNEARRGRPMASRIRSLTMARSRKMLCRSLPISPGTILKGRVVIFSA